MWLPQVLQAIGFLREVSWSFSCPLYCGGSVIPVFVSGCFCGLLTGILLYHFALRPFDLSSPPVPTFAPPELSNRARALRARARLSGYLHG